MRVEQDLTPLPQQGDNPESMSMQRYQEFEEEWFDAGAPATSAQQVVMVMSGAAIKSDPYDDIPF